MTYCNVATQLQPDSLSRTHSEIRTRMQFGMCIGIREVEHIMVTVAHMVPTVVAMIDPVATPPTVLGKFYSW